MKIALGCDHAGFTLKNAVIAAIEQAGAEVLDFGTFSLESVDYPDYAQKACAAVLAGEAEKGILICSSGVGINSRRTNQGHLRGDLSRYLFRSPGRGTRCMNVLCLGSRIIGSSYKEYRRVHQGRILRR